MALERGCIQIYTGNGKGKTTAAIGQGIRAVGNDLKVIMIQFLKSSQSGELKVFEKLAENFKLIRLENNKGFTWTLNEKQLMELREEIKTMLEFIKDIMINNKCDMIILDEILGTINANLVEEQAIIDLLKFKPNNMEVILTGRGASDKLIEISDLVTEMKPVKHYYDAGIGARKGIEY